jgi:hypothetical protein
MLTRTLAILTLIPLLTACASATTIRSFPSGAKVYLKRGIRRRDAARA